MNKTMSFAQYKEMYITQKQTTDTDTDINTKDDWDFYVNIENPNPNSSPIRNLNDIDIDIDINEINDSLLDNQIIVAAFSPSNLFFKICLPIAILILLY
jgi:hypothetical protein